MGFFEQFSKALDSLNEKGCSPSETMKNFREEYERQADEADRLLREKQAIEKENRTGQSYKSKS